MKTKLHVLMVTAFDLDEFAGGVNTMVRTLNDHLSADCRVSVLEQNWEARNPVRDVVKGIPRYKLRLQLPTDARRPVHAFVSWLIYFLPALGSLRRILRKEEIDLVHLHYASAYQYFFRITARLLGIPYIVTLHRGDVMNYHEQPPLHRWLMSVAVRGASKVVAVSSWLASQAVNRLGELPGRTVILNGLDFADLDALYDPAFQFSAPFEVPAEYFIMVSNVTHYKAQDVAIRAWAKVGESHPDLKLLIVGEERETWENCRRLIDELGCGATVRLLGSQTRRTAINLMHRARALIVPSRSEGLPYVLLEAGAIALPVICSNIGPFMEVVEDRKTAFVAPVEDHDAIAEAVNQVMAKPDVARDVGRALQTRVRESFSAEAMAAGYLRLYRAMTARA